MNNFPKKGNSRTISIDDCVQFSINTNACRGYCESYAVPSAPFVNGFKMPKPVTSVGQCCNIMETEDVNVMLSCVGGARNVTFKSATKCSCFNCKKDWIPFWCSIFLTFHLLMHLCVCMCFEIIYNHSLNRSHFKIKNTIYSILSGHIFPV